MEHQQSHRDWDAVEAFMECVTTCSIDDGECHNMRSDSSWTGSGAVAEQSLSLISRYGLVCFTPDLACAVLVGLALESIRSCMG